jgi:hypothetical protein
MVHIADDRLSALVHRDVLDPNGLIASVPRCFPDIQIGASSAEVGSPVTISAFLSGHNAPRWRCRLASMYSFGDFCLL